MNFKHGLKNKEKKCVICDKIFIAKKDCSTRVQKFCSKKCYGLSIAKFKKCPNCNIEFYHWNRKFCSRKCRNKSIVGTKLSTITKKKLSISHKGKKVGSLNNFWKGGITSENDSIRSSCDYKEWRKSVFERDNYTCQKTGERGTQIVAHHINNFADNKNLRLVVENGITLSKKSHEDFHKIYGKRNNNLQQLEEFLKSS